MLKNVTRSTFKRPIRYNSTSTRIFTSNDNAGFFDGPNGAAQAAIDAIPKRPEVVNVPKIHVEMTSPEDIADMVINPDFNDAFFTSLAKDSPFSGDQNYKVIPKDSSKDPVSVPLLFSDITRRYIKVYNDHIVPLKEVLDAVVYPTISKTVAQKIEENVALYMKENNTGDVLTIHHLNELGNKLRVFETTRLHSIGDYSTSNFGDSLSMENFVIYFLNKLEDVNLEQSTALVQLVTENISLLTVEGLRRIVETLARSLKTVESKQIFEVYSKFITNNVISNYPFILDQLQPTVLDDLAVVFCKANDIYKCRQVLECLVTKHRIVPRTETIEAYLLAYDKENHDRVTYIRDNHFLKSALFSINISSPIAKSVLRSVNCAFELDHFMKLVTKEHNVAILADIAQDIFLKCIEISESDLLAAVRVTQLTRRFLSHDVKLSPGAKRVLVNFYSEKEMSKNADYIQQL